MKGHPMHFLLDSISFITDLISIDSKSVMVSQNNSIFIKIHEPNKF